MRALAGRYSGRLAQQNRRELQPLLAHSRTESCETDSHFPPAIRLSPDSGPELYVQRRTSQGTRRRPSTGASWKSNKVHSCLGLSKKMKRGHASLVASRPNSSTLQPFADGAVQCSRGPNAWRSRTCGRLPANNALVRALWNFAFASEHAERKAALPNRAIRNGCFGNGRIGLRASPARAIQLPTNRANSPCHAAPSVPNSHAASRKSR